MNVYPLFSLFSCLENNLFILCLFPSFPVFISSPSVSVYIVFLSYRCLIEGRNEIESKREERKC